MMSLLAPWPGVQYAVADYALLVNARALEQLRECCDICSMYLVRYAQARSLLGLT